MKIGTFLSNLYSGKPRKGLVITLLVIFLSLSAAFASTMITAKQSHLTDNISAHELGLLLNGGQTPTTERSGITTLPYASLSSFIADLKKRMPGAGSEGFVQPSATDIDAFAAVVHPLLEAGTAEANRLASRLNYQLVQLHDSKLDQTYLILLENQNGFRGLGTYILNAHYRRNILIEVVHPFFDAQTLEEGTQLFQETGARALFVTGTHRCADSKPTPCSMGKTTACGGAYRISDAGHYTGTFFQAAHQATLSLSNRPVAISLHGNAAEDLPEVTLSDGTSQKSPSTALVNRLRKALKDSGVDVGSCNSAADGHFSLCGSTNVQGRLSNGSPNACDQPSQTATGFFIHIEQHIGIRNDPASLIKSFREVFPEERQDDAITARVR